MKHILVVMLIVFGLTASAYAIFIDNQDGTITQIRVDCSMLMWLQDTNTPKTSGYHSTGDMIWEDALAWINYLNSKNYLGHNDWRLPIAGSVNVRSYLQDGTSCNGSGDYGFNLSAPGSLSEGSTAIELAYLFYYELGNKGEYDITLRCEDTSPRPQEEWFTNEGPFINSQISIGGYWTGTEYPPNPNNVYYFNFYYGGYQYAHPKTNTHYAWAVRSLGIAPKAISSMPSSLQLATQCR